MIYNIVDNWNKLEISLKTPKDFQKGEWINFYIYKDHIKKNNLVNNEFEDLDNFTKIYFNVKKTR